MFRVWVWVLDRSQMRGLVVYLRLSMFNIVETMEGGDNDQLPSPMETNVSTVPCCNDYKFLYEEHSCLWLNVSFLIKNYLKPYKY